MRAQHGGRCVRCGKPYRLGDRIAFAGMSGMGTPRQAYQFRHAGKTDCEIAEPQDDPR